MKTIKNVRDLDKWLDDMRDAMVAQIQRGTEVKIANRSGGSDGLRSVIWQLRIDGVRDEHGDLTDELICLS